MELVFGNNSLLFAIILTEIKANVFCMRKRFQMICIRFRLHRNQCLRSRFCFNRFFDSCLLLQSLQSLNIDTQFTLDLCANPNLFYSNSRTSQPFVVLSRSLYSNSCDASKNIGLESDSHWMQLNESTFSPLKSRIAWSKGTKVAENFNSSHPRYDTKPLEQIACA